MKKSRVLTIMALSMLLTFISCSKKEAAKENKVLSIALTSEISTLDPVNSYDNVSGAILYNVYEQLFDYHYLNRPYELKPLLAEAMPVVENKGQRYIIKIKKDVRYHDHPAFKGKIRTVKAQDFITQIKRLAYTPLNSTGWWVLDGAVVGANEFKKAVGNDFEKFKSVAISGVSAPDDYTLIIDLTKPSQQFLYKMAMSFISPIPLEVVEYAKDDLSKETVGTGPFFLKSSDKNKIILEKFPHYRETLYPSEGDRYANSNGLLKDTGLKLPLINEVHFNIIPDDKTRWKLFNEKKLDLVVLPQEAFGEVFDSLGNLKEEIKAKNIHLQPMPTLTWWWVTFNMKDPLLGKNLNLRKAIAHAIDINKYIQLFTNNTGQKANSILPPGIFGYDPNEILPYEFNLDKARDYLAKAGYPGGKNLPELVYNTRSESNQNDARAEYFKSQLETIGIKVRLVKNNFNQYLEKSRTGHLQFFQDGWTLDYPDAENVFQLLNPVNFPPGPNSSFYNRSELNVLYEKMSNLPDGDEKKTLILKMVRIVNEDVPWVMLYYSRNFILYHDYVKNYRPSDLIWNYPKYIRMNQ